MKKVAIIYGSTTGNTEKAAELIRRNLTDCDVTLSEVSGATDELVSSADLVLLGSSTWGYGELQEDFNPYYETMSAELFRGKDVAVFGCGDKEGFADVFCEAVDKINEKALQCGATILAEGLKIDGDADDSLEQIQAFAKKMQ